MFPRITPPELDTERDDVEFQVLDWYIPEADRAAQKIQREQGFTGEWKDPEPYQIYMFGATHEGHSVCVRVNGFEPYFFVKMPESWWKDKSPSVIKSKVEDLKNKMIYEKIERKKFKSNETYMTNIIPYRLRDHLDYMKVVWRKDFWGFTNGKQFPFIKIRVKSLALFNSLKRYFEDENRNIEAKYRKKYPDISEDQMQRVKFQLYESNIDPFLRFIHEKDIQPSGWVRIPAGSYDTLEDDDGPVSRAGYNLQVNESDVESLKINKIAPILIASVDIECTSSHGDFPVATKNYRKLALDLLVASRAYPSKCNKETVIDWILTSFEKANPMGRGVEINRVYPKIKLSRAKLQAKLEPKIDEIVRVLQASSKKNTRNVPNDMDEHETNDMDDDMEDADAADDMDDAEAADGPSNSAFTNADRDKAVLKLLDLLGTMDEKGRWKGCLPELCGDPLIQIGTTVHKYGSDEIVYRHIATLKSCDPIEDADVEAFDTEEEVIMAWKELLQRLDPDIITGYNIFGFDMKYIYERAKELGVDDAFLLGLGRLQKRQTILDERKLSSSALGDNIMHSFDLDGVVQIDMLKVMQRDQKLDSYKLDNVAAQFLGDHKDDLKPRDIFEKFLGNASDRATVARYCLQDCALINRLIHKLKVLENNVGMANVCSVPLSYLFARGQGVKIFSLVAKECRAKQYLIPVLRGFRDVDLDGEDGYEGAIVLDPQEGMYLEDPITVLDYSSLYPSSMIARNLSHDCFVNDGEYENLEDEGITYLTVEYDVYEGKGDKKRVVGKKQCTFAQLPNGQKGIIPSILMKLLQQRKNTRKKIEYERLELSDGRVAMGLVKDMGDGKLEIMNVDQADIGKGFGGHKAVIESSLVVKRESAFTSFEQAVLDALQLAYKVTANSLYGQIGAKTSPIYWKDIAACTTATGREMIMLAKNFVETQYGAEVIYGDSVMPYTPVLLRNREDGKIVVKSISEVGTTWSSYDAFKSYDKTRIEKQQSPTNFEWDIWTDRGWSHIQRVIRHKCAKKIYLVTSQYGCVEVTEDHSLLDEKRKCIQPDKIKPDTKLLHSFPDLPELATSNSHIDAFYRFYDAKAAQDEYVYLTGIGCVVQVRAFLDKRKAPVYDLHVLPSRTPVNTEVHLMYDSGDYDGYVYDIETDEGVFQAGVGELIVKNTDSIFCKFPNRDPNGNHVIGKEALPIAIESGQKTSREIKALLPPPQCLEYEKTFFPFILFSKKRYVGNLYEDDPYKKPKQKSMGIVLKRRDNAPIVKKIYGGIIDILLNKNDLQASVQFLKEQLQNLVDGKCPLEDLIISKTLKADYKDPTKIAHKVLAERMGERDPGNKPMVNDRIPFVYIIPPSGTEAKLQGDRIEHPEYIREQSLTPDYCFYITNQLLKPICQLYALCVEEIPGYTYAPGYWDQMDIEMETHPLYVNPKKRKDRIQAMKMRIVEDILFQPFIEQLGGPVKKSSSSGAVRKAKKASANTASKPEVSITHQIDVDTKEIKRGKKYQLHAVMKDVTSGNEVWKGSSKEVECTKMDAHTRAMQQILQELVAANVEGIVGLRIVIDKSFAKTWKQAIKKEETLYEEMKQSIASQDTGRLVEIQQLQRMMNLVRFHSHIPYEIEEK